MTTCVVEVASLARDGGSGAQAPLDETSFNDGSGIERPAFMALMAVRIFNALLRNLLFPPLDGRAARDSHSKGSLISVIQLEDRRQDQGHQPWLLRVSQSEDVACPCCCLLLVIFWVVELALKPSLFKALSMDHCAP